MKRPVAAVAAALFLISAAPAATGAASPGKAVARDCGNYGYIADEERTGWTSGQVDGAGIFNVTARKTPCAAARRVALHASPERKPRYRGWKCHYLKRSYENVKVRCEQTSTQTVTWESGA